MSFLKNEKIANWELGKVGNLGNLGKIIPSFRFSPTAKIENSDFKFLEKNFRDFRDFQGFQVFHLASQEVCNFTKYLLLLKYFSRNFAGS